MEWFKARLVAKGYNQQAGIAYHEACSPIVKIVNVRIVLLWLLFTVGTYVKSMYKCIPTRRLE